MGAKRTGDGVTPNLVDETEPKRTATSATNKSTAVRTKRAKPAKKKPTPKVRIEKAWRGGRYRLINLGCMITIQTLKNKDI
jgi:hypothetical protein